MEQSSDEKKIWIRSDLKEVARIIRNAALEEVEKWAETQMRCSTDNKITLFCNRLLEKLRSMKDGGK